MTILNRTFKSIQEKGLTRTFQSFISVVEDFYFEMKYGIKTSKMVKRENLDISDISKEHSEPYRPTRIRHFKRLMNILRLPGGCVFVDMGSGMGRVLLMASEYNFKRIVGVEISSRLCIIARNNVVIFEKKLRRTSNIEVVNADVLQYNIRNDENVFYFYRPFDNFIMEKIIEQILKSLKNNPRKVWLIINNFIQYNDMIEQKNIFHRSIKFTYGGTEFAVYETD